MDSPTKKHASSGAIISNRFRLNNMETTYKGYLIKEVHRFSNGKSDFQVYPDEGREEGRIYPETTLENIKAEIDQL